MGSLNISLGPKNEERKRGYTYRDFDIRLVQNIDNKDINTISDLKAIQNGLRNIFSWEQGQRILLPAFGNNLRKFLYEPLDTKLISDIGADLRTTIERWEPRILIEDVLVNTDPNDPHTLIVELSYYIPTLSEKRYVYEHSLNPNIGPL